MRIAFFGTPDFGRTILSALLDAGEEIVLVVTQPDRPRQRRGRGPDEPSAIKRFAAEHGLPVLTPQQAVDTVGEIEGTDPDVCIVAAYGQILPDSLLKQANGRWLNVHASLLPAYRGASPVTQAILDGRAETGVTIMKLVPKLDAGPILSQAAVPIANDDTTASLSEKLADTGGKLLVKTLPKYQAGKIVPQPQDETSVTMTRTLKKADGQVDWTRDAEYLTRFVRAMQPWPGAHTMFNGNPVTVVSAHSEPGSNASGHFKPTPPLSVGTGKDNLVIDRLIPSGRREMDGSAWLNGIRQAGNFDS